MKVVCFRCQLPERTLYLAYLMPMCAIIVHNVIVFSVVLHIR